MKTGAARRLDPDPQDDPTPETFLEEIQRIFESGTLRGAREVAAEGLAYFPEHGELRRLHHALRPTEARTVLGYRIPDRQDTFEWIRDNAENYRGQWVAVLGTDPIAASPDLEEVRQAVRSRKLRLGLFSTSLTEKSILPGWGRRPFATGVSRYADHEAKAQEPDPRIHLEVTPGLLEAPVLAIVDTAAPWCLFAPAIGESLRRDFSPISGGLSLSTRLGSFKGCLYLVPIILPAREGESLVLDATVFVSPDWFGGNFIGYEGLLQRIRFAVDPEKNLFYFGQI